MGQRSIFGIGLILLLGWAVSCRSVATQRTATEATPPQAEHMPAPDQAALLGRAKIQENDCASCHALERKSLGPSYAAIAARYEATGETVAMLAERIMSGSVGEWGEIPMTAHPEISREEAEQMVKFVFTLKN